MWAPQDRWQTCGKDACRVCRSFPCARMHNASLSWWNSRGLVGRRSYGYMLRRTCNLIAPHVALPRPSAKFEILGSCDLSQNFPHGPLWPWAPRIDGQNPRVLRTTARLLHAPIQRSSLFALCLRSSRSSLLGYIPVTTFPRPARCSGSLTLSESVHAHVSQPSA